MSPTPFVAAGCKVWLTLCLALLLAMPARAFGITVLQADDLPAHAEFVRQLKDSQDPSGGFALVRVGPQGIATANADMAAVEDDRVGGGVRTRSARANNTGTGAVPPSITIAVGLDAAKAALERPGTDPLVLAMLSRLDYESLKANPALRRVDRRVGVLLRDPAMADAVALVDAALPRKRRLGIVVTDESEPLLQDVRRATSGWDLQVEYAADPRSLARALKVVLPRSDALLVLPDLIGDDQAATLAVLRAAATAGVPVFGASDGLVRSGGLAATVSTPTLLARQARILGRKVMAGGGAGAPLVESATPATVRVNATVARALGLRLPDERELTERVAAVR
ncbi:ABC transporter substrate-binding protein [Variovorax robiniae]|uniref:ABC transporter substrate-binding protein n=1 Tax=Variovorax robiniae TaxID=1836199 RepID=A0ABU8XFX6_9BURK